MSTSLALVTAALAALPVLSDPVCCPADDPSGTSTTAQDAAPIDLGALDEAALLPVDAERARALFERFASLDGHWIGHSTQGWVNDMTRQTIARGSVVEQRSLFEAHPGETMVTMFHLDGERLLLTHYCVAKNQPRLVADRVSADGRIALFRFLDATNLASIDQGHMHRVAYRFGDEDFTSRWTWFQEGAESWMEEIEYRRAEEAR